MSKQKNIRDDAFWILVACLLCAALVFLVRNVHTNPNRSRFISKLAKSSRTGEPAPGEIAESIIITGDAGNMSPPAVEILRSELRIEPALSTVLFLGDNVYSFGIVPPGAPDYEGSKERLMRQIAPVKESGVRALFIPGNHDWNFGKAGGWEAIRRQQAIIDTALGAESFAPRNGCPGPVTALVTEHFRFIALDSEWWVHEGEKPIDESSGCATYTPEMIFGELRRLLAEKVPGRRDIVLTHHPIESTGPHANGSRCPHDFGCPANRAFRAGLLALFNEFHPFLCAAGHDHSLQLIETEDGCEHYIVSGALTTTTTIRPRPELSLGFTELGLFRLDLLKSGATVLTAVHRSEKTGTVERMTLTLDEGR